LLRRSGNGSGMIDFVMTDETTNISPKVQPNPADYEFDLGTTLKGMVSVRAHVPEDAMTASVLGTERSGHGVVIDDKGLILTIGYVVQEAESVWLIDHSRQTVPGHVVGYDQQSGFGLVQALTPLELPPIPLGNSADLMIGQSMILAGSGGRTQCVRSKVVGVREFAGYWEYLLDDAIFTQPAHPVWGGTGLIGEDGHLYGIGSLILQTVDQNGESSAANMIVPVDELKPILSDLCQYGQPQRAARPWIGWYVQDTREGLTVAGVVENCPADEAGVESGDIVTAIDGAAVDDLADMYRAIWGAGGAGVSIAVTISRDGSYHVVSIDSVDRRTRLKTAKLH